MMPRAVALSGTPGEPDRGGKLFERSKIAEELLFKVPKIHLVESEEGWNTRHSLSGATSVTLIHCQGNAGFRAFL